MEIQGENKTRPSAITIIGIIFMIIMAGALAYLLYDKYISKAENNKSEVIGGKVAENVNDVKEDIVETPAVVSKVQSKYRAYTYEYNSEKEQTPEVFKSIASESMGQMYVSLILEEEDVSSFGVGIIKNFMLTVLNKQMRETYKGNYIEENGKITLYFQSQLTKSYEMPSKLTFEISENNITIDDAKLQRNDSIIKVYGYTNENGDTSKIMPSISSMQEIYVRVILDTKQLVPETFSGYSFLLTTFNKQMPKEYIGQYLINENKLTLNYTDNIIGHNEAKSIISDYTSTVIKIDNIELKLIK